jgi:hypothetical protein
MASPAREAQPGIPDEHRYSDRESLRLVPQPGEDPRAVAIRAFEALVQARLLYELPVAEEDIPVVENLDSRSDKLRLDIEGIDPADLTFGAYGLTPSVLQPPSKQV